MRFQARAHHLPLLFLLILLRGALAPQGHSAQGGSHIVSCLKDLREKAFPPGKSRTPKNMLNASGSIMGKRKHRKKRSRNGLRQQSRFVILFGVNRSITLNLALNRICGPHPDSGGSRHGRETWFKVIFFSFLLILNTFSDKPNWLWTVYKIMKDIISTYVV